MLVQIDSQEQMINTDRIETMLIDESTQDQYIVKMFNGEIVYIKNHVAFRIQQKVNG